MEQKVVYTDGSCLKNPDGPGGWAYCLVGDECDVLVSGGESRTTNNRMEMMAVIAALEEVGGGRVRIYSDSQLVIRCASGEWKRKANADLWRRYDKAVCGSEVEWCWVKGHSGNYYNEIVDKAAKEQAKFYEKNNLVKQ